MKCIKCFFPETDANVIGAYRAKFDDLCKHCTKLREYAKPTPKELLKLTTFEKIIEKRDALCEELDEYYSDKHIKHILLCLYTMFPPLRNQDWCESKLYSRASRIKKDDLSTTRALRSAVFRCSLRGNAALSYFLNRMGLYSYAALAWHCCVADWSTVGPSRMSRGISSSSRGLWSVPRVVARSFVGAPRSSRSTLIASASSISTNNYCERPHSSASTLRDEKST